jgi:RimJ/RimL family protein N-acetyltransferase
VPDPLPLPVRTERLLLRAATPADAETTWTFRRLPEVAEWITERPADLEAYRATFTDPDRLATTLVVEHEGEVVGDLMLRREDAWAQKEVAEAAHAAQAELGWVLDPRFTGRGFATEAVRELVRLCFEDLGVRRVVAYCFSDNEASWRLMERLGMRRETHAVKESLHRSGKWLDSYGYALLAEEWSASR